MWESEEDNAGQRLVVLTARFPKEGGRRDVGRRGEEGSGGVVNEMGREAWEQLR